MIAQAVVAQPIMGPGVGVLAAVVAQVAGLGRAAYATAGLNRLQKTVGARVVQRRENKLDAFILSILKDAGCCLLYTSPSPRDRPEPRLPSSA